MRNEVRASYFAQRLHDARSAFAVIPEEVLSLRFFGFGIGGAIYFFACVGVNSGIIYLGAQRHRCGSEVLNLFKVHVELASGSR